MAVGASGPDDDHIVNRDAGATMATPEEIVRSYADTWNAGDFDTMHSLLADDLTFVGPLDTFHDADSQQRAIKGLSAIKTGILVERVWADGPDVLLWYRLETKVADPAPVAEWHHVQNGRISEIRVVFDARPFANARP